MTSDPGRPQWRLHWVAEVGLGAQDHLPETDGIWSLNECRTARAATFGNDDSYPVFIRPDGSPDATLLEFATVGYLGGKSFKTKQTYAIEIRAFLDFMLLQKRGREWSSATFNDIRDYEYFKRRDRSRNVRLIDGDTWDKVLAALSLLFTWAEEAKIVDVTPVRRRHRSSSRSSSERRGSQASDGAEQASSYRVRADVRWHTKRAYERWRQIGFEDYSRDGLPRDVERIRTSARNVAFADLLYGTGMRRQEGAGLLTFELPEVSQQRSLLSGTVPAALAKGKRERKFYVERRHLAGIDRYLRYQRRETVHRAQSEGRYDRVSNPLVVERVYQRSSGLAVTYSSHGKRVAGVAVSAMSLTDRQRLYVEGEGGLEPASVWLTESGRPAGIDGWTATFDDANARLVREGVDIRITPHMLRHSYALHMLVQVQRSYLVRFGMEPDERLRYQRLFGNVWQLVRDLLGHSSEETTKRWYLAPVRGLALDELLTAESDSPVSSTDDVLAAIGESTGLVVDDRRALRE